VFKGGSTLNVSNPHHKYITVQYIEMPLRSLRNIYMFCKS